MEMNSGQRSQYNPHSQTNRRGDDYNNERNSSDNSSQEVDKACALHCFLENLHMVCIEKKFTIVLNIFKFKNLNFSFPHPAQSEEMEI